MSRAGGGLAVGDLEDVVHLVLAAGGDRHEQGQAEQVRHHPHLTFRL